MRTRGDLVRGWLRRRPVLVAAGAAVALILVVGCASALRFPASPLVAKETPTGLTEAYDTDGDNRADFFTLQDAAGRVVRIAYDNNADGAPDEFVDLDAIPFTECRHVVLIIDGVGYDTVEAFRREGRLRLFYPPTRVIATFPAMTDMSLADVYRTRSCVGFEVVYFDRAANRLAGGDADYLSLKNEEWVRYLAYRAGTLMDPFAYLYPAGVFEKELGNFREAFNRNDRAEVAVYFVGSAGLGTRKGLEGQRKVLDSMDRLAAELVWQTRGHVKITVFSDHGHTLQREERINFREFLAENGWRVADRLERPRDVAPIEYGLITYAAFAVDDKPALAATLLRHPGVDLVTYAQGDAVVVEKPDAKAFVERRGNRYRYRVEGGDPLELAPVIEQMKRGAGQGGPVFDADGFADDAAWFRHTVTHHYPDAPNRLWRTFNGMVEHPPDVVASLKENSCAGLASRAFWLSSIESTHGDLARKSSTAFIMSTAGPVPAPAGALRHRDLPALLEQLTGRPWPASVPRSAD